MGNSQGETTSGNAPHVAKKTERLAPPKRAVKAGKKKAAKSNSCLVASLHPDRDGKDRSRRRPARPASSCWWMNRNVGTRCGPPGADSIG